MLCLSFALVIVFLFMTCRAQTRVADLATRTEGDLCFLWGHRIALVGDQLFFLNGNYTFEPATSAVSQPYLYSLELNSNLPVEKYIPSSAIQSYSLPPSLTSNAAVQDEDDAGALWFSNDTLYASEPNLPPNTLWSFDITKHDWTSVSVSGDNVSMINGSSEMSASIPQSGLSFSFGLSDIPGFIRFDASNPASLKWRNQTTFSSQNIPVPFVGNAEMVYLPFGQEGILLLLGGFDPFMEVYNSLSQISVYDIKSQNWYEVTASGAPPGYRSQFCAVVSAAPDYTSFQVTIYGGWYLQGSIDYEDVWVLTVPSFQWIQVHALNNLELDTTADIGRAHHRCAVYNDAQMIVLGGSVRTGTATPTNETSCKPQYPPIRVLDTTTYTWKTQFDPSMKYGVPSVVSDIIGGDALGNANITEPAGGFNYTALAGIFSPRVGEPTPVSSTSPMPSSTATPAAPSSTANTSRTPTGAIAGGVVGGVVLLVALTGLLYYIRVKRERHLRNKGSEWRKTELPADSKTSPLPELQEITAPKVVELDSERMFELLGPSVVHEIGNTH